MLECGWVAVEGGGFEGLSEFFGGNGQVAVAVGIAREGLVEL